MYQRFFVISITISWLTEFSALGLFKVTTSAWFLCSQSTDFQLSDLMCSAIMASLPSDKNYISYIQSLLLQQMDQEYTDEWLEEKTQVKGSIFERKEVDYGNRVIDQNIERLMEKPILNKPFEDYEENEDNEESLNKEAKNEAKQTEAQEALYNPIEDEENQKWMKKHCKKAKAPLNCPSCFNQLAYDYQLHSQDEQSKSYICRQVFGVEVKENKIIRAANVAEKMQWAGAEGEQAQKWLMEREQAINVKIVAECNCGYSIGYYDINKQSYVLTNVL